MSAKTKKEKKEKKCERKILQYLNANLSSRVTSSQGSCYQPQAARVGPVLILCYAYHHIVKHIVLVEKKRKREICVLFFFNCNWLYKIML